MNKQAKIAWKDEFNIRNETINFYFMIEGHTNDQKIDVNGNMCSCKRNNYFNMVKQRMCWNQIKH